MPVPDRFYLGGRPACIASYGASWPWALPATTGYEVIPTCPFVRHLLEEHSEYDDVLVRKQSRGTSPQRNEAESTQPRQDVSFAC